MRTFAYPSGSAYGLLLDGWSPGWNRQLRPDDDLGRLLMDAAKLTPTPDVDQTMYAQTPMRFHDMAVDPAPLFDGAISRPDLLMHLMGTLAPAWNIEHELDALTMLTLLLHGRSGYVVPHVLWDGIPASFPNATFHLFEGSGHQPFVEEPAAFTDVVTRWLRQTAA